MLHYSGSPYGTCQSYRVTAEALDMEREARWMAVAMRAVRIKSDIECAIQRGGLYSQRSATALYLGHFKQHLGLCLLVKNPMVTFISAMKALPNILDELSANGMDARRIEIFQKYYLQAIKSESFSGHINQLRRSAGAPAVDWGAPAAEDPRVSLVVGRSRVDVDAAGIDPTV